MCAGVTCPGGGPGSGTGTQMLARPFPVLPPRGAPRGSPKDSDLKGDPITGASDS